MGRIHKSDPTSNPRTTSDCIRLVRRTKPGFAPLQTQRLRRVVVVERDIDSHVAARLTPGEEVDAQFRAAALQVLSEIKAAALACLDDAIANEAHVRLALTQ